MARFDLYRLAGGRGYAVDVQSDHASSKLRTRVAAPLIALEELGAPIAELNPVVRIGERDYACVMQSLATLTRRELGEHAGSLAEHQDALVRALDILLTGF